MTTKVPFKGYNNNIHNNIIFKLIIKFYCTQGDPTLNPNKQSQILENIIKCNFITITKSKQYDKHFCSVFLNVSCQLVFILPFM